VDDIHAREDELDGPAFGDVDDGISEPDAIAGNSWGAAAVVVIDGLPVPLLAGDADDLRVGRRRLLADVPVEPQKKIGTRIKSGPIDQASSMVVLCDGLMSVGTPGRRRYRTMKYPSLP